MEFIAWIRDAALHAPLAWVAFATIGWFTAIFAAIAGMAWLFAMDRGQPIPGLREGQVRRELLLSATSIVVFGLLAVLLVLMVRRGWIAIAWERSPWNLAWELPLLYLWNEIHFATVHRVLHLRPLYRRVHLWHHRSVATTPFTAYSFHPVESMLLGTVMPLVLLIGAFSPWALAALTIMSLMLNVAGHVPELAWRPAFALAAGQSRHHNRHHRQFRTHFAFSLPLLERWIP